MTDGKVRASGQLVVTNREVREMKTGREQQGVSHRTSNQRAGKEDGRAMQPLEGAVGGHWAD